MEGKAELTKIYCDEQFHSFLRRHICFSRYEIRVVCGTSSRQ